MSEVEQTRVRERDRPAEAEHPYEVLFQAFMARRELAERGRVVVRARDVPWQQSRQGRSKYLLHDLTVKDTAVRDWMVFQKDIGSQSGRHTHQGGLVIYVTRGRGYSMIDGVRYDWKPGDLMVLPVQPGGCDHQHFNDDDSGVSPQWVALLYLPLMHATGSMLEQVAEQKGWRDEAAVSWDQGAAR